MYYLTILLLIPLFVLLFYIIRKKPVENLLDDWAQSESFEIVNYKYTPNIPVKSVLYSVFRQSLFTVEIKDSSGNLKKCYVLCGHWFFGLLSKKIKVFWSLEEL